MDFLSIPEYVIKKGRPHGHRYGKKPGDREYHLAHNLKKRCKKRDFKGIHDRFLRDHVFRERMIENNRDEEVCRAWDVLAEQDHTYRMPEEEYFYYKNKWWITLTKSGNTTQPVRKRSDFNQALCTSNRVHREAGGQQLRPMPYWKYKEWKPWWQWRESWWSSSEFKSMKRMLRSNGATRCLKNFGENLRRMAFTKSFYSVTDRSFTLQLTSVHCNRRGV